MKMRFDKVMDIIRSMKEYYSTTQDKPHTEKFFDVAAKIVETNEFDMYANLEGYTNQDILNAWNFFNKESVTQDVYSMTTDMDTIDATYNDVMEVWNTILRLLNEKVQCIKPDRVLEETKCKDNENESSTLVSSIQEIQRKDEDERIYKVTFLDYTNVIRGTIKGPEGEYINIKEPMLISEKDIPYYSTCGGGFEKLEFVGYLKRLRF